MNHLPGTCRCCGARVLLFLAGPHAQWCDWIDFDEVDLRWVFEQHKCTVTPVGENRSRPMKGAARGNKRKIRTLA